MKIPQFIEAIGYYDDEIDRDTAFNFFVETMEDEGYE